MPRLTLRVARRMSPRRRVRLAMHRRWTAGLKHSRCNENITKCHVGFTIGVLEAPRCVALRTNSGAVRPSSRPVGPALRGSRCPRGFIGALVALLAPALALTPQASPLAAQQSVPALEEAARRYREVSAICADFEQVIETLYDSTIATAGQICQQRPNLFSMRFTDPDGDMVIGDGEYVWVYYPSIDERQVNRFPTANSPGREDFFRELLEDPGSKYEAEEGGIEAVGGRECRVVVLTPREGASYRRARLWLDVRSHVMRRVELHEQSGNIRTLTLSDIDLSSTPDPALFVFEVPEGARVIGMRGPVGAGAPNGPAGFASQRVMGMRGPR